MTPHLEISWAEPSRCHDEFSSHEHAGAAWETSGCAVVAGMIRWDKSSFRLISYPCFMVLVHLHIFYCVKTIRMLGTAIFGAPLQGDVDREAQRL